MAFMGIFLMLLMAALAVVLVVVGICTVVALIGLIILLISSGSRAKSIKQGKFTKLKGIPGIVIGAVLIAVPMFIVQSGTSLTAAVALKMLSASSTYERITACIDENDLSGIVHGYCTKVDQDHDDLNKFQECCEYLDLSDARISRRQEIYYEIPEEDLTDSNTRKIMGYIITLCDVQLEDPDTGEERLVTIKVSYIRTDYQYHENMGIWWISIDYLDDTNIVFLGEEVPFEIMSSSDVDENNMWT